MIGTRLGVYQLQEEIGRGGMAAVYRAYQPSVGRFVAIKVIQKDLADDPVGVQRFQQEARLIARLEHPHILPVYDFDGAHQPPYIVMRYLESGSLKEVIQRAQLPLEEVFFLTRQLASALDYAHRQGVIHRDIKPSNILIDREGNAFITDFGIARLLDAAFQLTQTGMAIGTVDYMSPEQALGGQTLDHRSDLYSFGIMVFEMLCGRLPYAADNPMAVMLHHLQTPTPDITDFNPSLPQTLIPVFKRILAKSVDVRYASAHEFVNALLNATQISLPNVPQLLQTFVQTQTRLPNSTIKGSITTSKPTMSEQNKRVTVLYTDVSDYWEMLEMRHGVEAARKESMRFVAKAQQLQQELGGVIVERSEKHLMTLWGADLTQEDDPERAIQAALNVRAAMCDLTPHEEIPPIQLGVHTGVVLLCLADNEIGITATGANLTLAHRIAQNSAGDVLISHDTFRLIYGIFDLTEGEPLKVRGRKEAVNTYRVASRKERSFREFLRGIEGVETAFVGRQIELQQLQKAYLNAVEDSETQSIMLIGDAGIGKSRLLFEFRKWADLRAEAVWMFRARATTTMTQRPYALLRELLSFRFEILDNDTTEIVRTKLEKGMARLIGPDSEMVAFIGHMAGFDFQENPHIKGLLDDPQQLTRRAQRLFVRLIQQMCHESPMLITLDDLHYADDASLDLIDLLINDQPQLRLIVVCSARASLLQRYPSWGSKHRLITLYPLDKRDSRDLAQELLQKVQDLPKELRDLLVERAEGNPLYMEEMVKMLIEDRIIYQGDTEWQVEVSRLQNLSVPPTLLGLLQTRIDTLLFPEKIALQRASVIGRVFYDTAIISLDEFDDTKLYDISTVLDQLVQRGFIRRRESSAFAGSMEYTFTQHLMRDAIYDTLLRRQYQSYHTGAAEWLYLNSGQRLNEYLPLIAEHFERAGDHENAGLYLYGAGERAYQISALSDALRLFERALAILDEKFITERLMILIALGKTLITMGRYLDAEIYLLNAWESSQVRGTRFDQADILLRLAELYLLNGHHPQAQEALQKVANFINTINTPLIQSQYHLQSGNLALTIGQLVEASEHFASSYQAAQEGEHFSLMIESVMGSAVVYRQNRELFAATEKLEQGYHLAKQHGNRLHQLRCLIELSEILAEAGELEVAYNSAKESLQVTEEIGENLYQKRILDHLIRIAEALGQPDEAAHYRQQRK
ncbi:MAG: protein kinase [Anaerolineae bacterium]|jgi:serine/threonine protein kinase/tetratricopeptide (TPR) repeat protein|nr:protein kinase [Anaerolineae bacterium]